MYTVYLKYLILECLVLFLTVSPIFVRPTIESNNDTRLIVLSDQNSSTEYCSELQSRNISVACRAVGIPKPQVDILVNGNIIEPFNQTEEVVITLAPISYGEVVMFECQASTMTTTRINITYTCKCTYMVTFYVCVYM